VIEQPDLASEPEQCRPPTEKPPAAPEKKEQGRPQASPRPRREAEERRPEEEAGLAQPQSALGTLASLGQVTSLTRTTAMTRPLGTVNPGASGLGLGIRWIHIPIPFLRIFTVEETPSVTVPLSEANLTAVGGGVSGLLGTEALGAGGRGLSREEIAALVAQELAARRAQAARQEAPARCPPEEDSERRRLEKKLSNAEAQIEKMSEVLKALDEKIPAKNSDRK